MVSMVGEDPTVSMVGGGVRYAPIGGENFYHSPMVGEEYP
jgi:hypothetical protein